MVLIIAFFMTATLLVVLTGFVAMTKGGDFNRRYGTRLMMMRVALQGLTIALLLLMAISKI